jgi:hypothetical protein
MQHRPVIIQLNGLVYTATHQPTQWGGGNFCRKEFWSYEKRTATPEHRLLAGGPMQADRPEDLRPEQVLKRLMAMALSECELY